MIPPRVYGARGAYSRAAALGLSLAASIALLALAGASCARPGPVSRGQPSLGAEGGSAGASEALAPAAPGDESAGDASPLARQAASEKAPKPPAVQAAPSLAGHDRFLALGEGRPIPAADFLIGPLASSVADERMAPMELLRGGIAKRELDPKAFTGASWRISSLVFGPAYSRAKPVQELRVGRPKASEGSLALAFRLLGDELSATGQAILHSDAGGYWLIEHFELDTDALSSPRQALEGWEPPLALYP